MRHQHIALQELLVVLWLYLQANTLGFMYFPAISRHKILA